jgi:hypothetical protein
MGKFTRKIHDNKKTFKLLLHFIDTWTIGALFVLPFCDTTKALAIFVPTPHLGLQLLPFCNVFLVF